jgi:sugar/nucleoside kinase (ribokinase family)
LAKEKKIDVLVHGYVCTDNIVNYDHTAIKSGSIPTDNKIHFSAGGVNGNTGTVLANLGRRVLAVGRVGKDPQAAALVKHFESLGAKCFFIEDERYETSSSIILIDPKSGERTILHNPGANLGTLNTDLSDSDLKSAKHYHYGYLFLSGNVDVVSLLKRAKRLGLSTSFDTHGSPTKKDKPLFEECCKYSSIAFPSYDELKGITGLSDPKEMCKYLSTLGPKLVGVKLGEDGAIGQTQGKTIQAPAFKVKAVSTLGAGDSFFAGVIDAYLDKKPLKEILVWANAVAASSVQGISTTHVNRKSVEKIIKKLD